MQSEEQRLIEGLFQRLQQAEQQSGARDAAADRQIQEFIRQQPAAPYYMAQSILIQEAALKRLHQQVQRLESELTELKKAPPAASGGFLSNLFGGGSRAAQPQQPSQPSNVWGNSPQQTPPPGYNGYAQTPPPGYNGYGQTPPPGGYAQQPVPPRGGGFMAGALQTAAGVAGGVVLGNMLTGMFHNSRPEEIVNVIDQPMDAATDPLTNQNFQSDNLDTFNDVSDSHFLEGDNNYLGSDSTGSDTDYNNADNGFGGDNGFGSDNSFGTDDSFGSDDDFSDDDNFV